MAYARVSTYQFPAEQADQAAPAFEDAIENLQEIEGVTDALLLVDRNSGKAITITVWESQDALTASEQQADEIRQRGAASGGGEIAGVERYEVALRRSF